MYQYNLFYDEIMNKIKYKIKFIFLYHIRIYSIYFINLIKYSL